MTHELPDAHALAARCTAKIAFSAPFERDEKDGDNDRAAMAVDGAPALIEPERDVASAPKRTFLDVELDMAQPAAKRQGVHGGCDQDKDERGIVDLVGSPSRTATPQREGSCIACCTNDSMAGCGRGEEFERREAQMRQEIEELRKQNDELRRAKDFADSRAVAHILEEIAELRQAKDSESREMAEIRKEIAELRQAKGEVNDLRDAVSLQSEKLMRLWRALVD